MAEKNESKEERSSEKERGRQNDIENTRSPSVGEPSNSSSYNLPPKKEQTLKTMKTMADEMLYVAEKLNSSALYINKLLEVLLLTPEEYSELSEAGVVDKPLVQSSITEKKSSNPDMAQLLQLAQGTDMEAIAQTLLARMQGGKE